MTIHEQITHLEQTILRLHQHIGEIEKELNKLSASDFPRKMEVKEQELREVRRELQTCQQEREKIRRKLNEKMRAIETSNLADEVKVRQMMQLLTQSRAEMDLVNEALIRAWASYNAQNDKLVEHLARPCSTCGHKDKVLADSTYLRNWLIGVVSLLLLLLARPWRPKKPKKNLKYDNLTRISQ